MKSIPHVNINTTYQRGVGDALTGRRKGRPNSPMIDFGINYLQSKSNDISSCTRYAEVKSMGGTARTTRGEIVKEAILEQTSHAAIKAQMRVQQMRF